MKSRESSKTEHKHKKGVTNDGHHPNQSTGLLSDDHVDPDSHVLRKMVCGWIAFTKRWKYVKNVLYENMVKKININ